MRPENNDGISQKEIEAWCRNLVATVKDGGVWGIPRSGLVFQIDKKAKQLTLISGDSDSSDFSATQAAFKDIGWRVTKKKQD